MIVKEMTVPPQGEGERADKLIRRYFPELPERSVRDAFSRKDVKLDGKRVPKDTVVRAGQVLKIYTAEENAAGPEVVYEDARILLVNKPAGVSVEPDAKGGVTLTDLCAAYVRKENPAAEAPMACHRLDNPTCGLCLFAKDEETKEILEDMFRNRSMEKEYECLVRGLPKPPAAVCTAYLVKDAKAARVRVTDRPEEGAKKIVTGYETKEAGPVSRLRVRLMTGRTHQIRAHLAALGHPILGDDVYGDRAFNRAKKARGLKLCAVRMKMDTEGKIPELDGKEFEIRAPF